MNVSEYIQPVVEVYICEMLVWALPKLSMSYPLQTLYKSQIYHTLECQGEQSWAKHLQHTKKCPSAQCLPLSTS